MCGIFGVNILNETKNYSNIKDSKKVLESLMLMFHRGPDNQQVKFVNNKLILGHVRLSIIDTNSNNNQPFVSVCGKYYIVFNGEIYNYIEIRNELQKKGYFFTTQGDTEVLLNSYIEWGEECVNKFNGMWAFTIFDSNINKLFCSRDRFGVKPFNYIFYKSEFVFSSEIKSIIKYLELDVTPNFTSIDHFCKKGIGAQSTETWFNGILRLQPATNLIIEQDGSYRIDRYWNYPSCSKELENKKNIELNLKKLFFNAVNIRMRSDVPVGLALSSGVDSMSIAYVMKNFTKEKIYSYTAYSKSEHFLNNDKKGYANNNVIINEKEIVEKSNVDLNFNQKFVCTDYSNLIEELKDIVYHLESGQRSPAIIALDQMYLEAKKELKVVLEGQGADELLAGYLNLFVGFYVLDLLKTFQIKKAIKTIYELKKSVSLLYTFKLFIRSIDISVFSKINLFITGQNKIFIGNLSNIAYRKDSELKVLNIKSFLKQKLIQEHSGTLINLLHYGDAISMKHSLESRHPFMDYKLVNYVFQLSGNELINKGLGKYIFRKSMLGIVPKEIILNPLKFGFNTPLTLILRNNIEEIKSLLLSDTCINRKLFDKAHLEKLLNKLNENKKVNSDLIFRILLTEIWFQVFIDVKK
jgi:asparagine synthase (glutamine-hydrolysing)